MDTADGATLRLVAHLVREACGLDDREPVTLDCGAETLREMALAAKNEIDALRGERRGFELGRAAERRDVVEHVNAVARAHAMCGSNTYSPLRGIADDVEKGRHLPAKEKSE